MENFDKQMQLSQVGKEQSKKNFDEKMQLSQAGKNQSTKNFNEKSVYWDDSLMGRSIS